MTTASGLVALDLLGHRADDLGVGAEQIVAAHARLAGDAGGDHDDVAAGRVVVVVGADDVRVEAHDRRGLHQVERLALGHVLGLRNVQQHDVAQLGGGAPMGRRRADVAGADNGDLGTTHKRSLRMTCDEERGRRKGSCRLAVKIPQVGGRALRCDTSPNRSARE